MNTSWLLTNLSSIFRCEFLNFQYKLSLKSSCISFINSRSSAITGRNLNWRDNLCPSKICGPLCDWLRLTKESSRIQPCIQGRSTGSFPEKRLVIEPIQKRDASNHTNDTAHSKSILSMESTSVPLNVKLFLTELCWGTRQGWKREQAWHLKYRRLTFPGIIVTATIIWTIASDGMGPQAFPCPQYSIFNKTKRILDC